MPKSSNPTRAKEPGVYAVDDDVLITKGFYAGQEGVVHEIDESDPVTPYAIRFEIPDGDRVAWFGADAIKHASAVAR